MGVCNCSTFCCALLYVHSSIAIILMGKRELIALLNLSSWCLVIFEQLFLAVPRGCLQFGIYLHETTCSIKVVRYALQNRRDGIELNRFKILTKFSSGPASGYSTWIFASQRAAQL